MGMSTSIRTARSSGESERALTSMCKCASGTRSEWILRLGPLPRSIPPISLMVGSAWQTSLTGQGYTIFPKEGLFRTAEFLARTGLTSETLAHLITEQLDSEELANGTADQLFINASGEGLPRLAVVFDQSDPDQPMGRIVGLSFKRLDRLNRFIRLQRALGWAYADVDWAIRRAGENPGQEISDALIVSLTKILAPLQKTKAIFDELSGLWSDVKTIGRVNKKTPQDAFDRIFNRPALLGGKNPYETGSSVPFNPDRTPVQKWTIAGKSAEDQTIRSRLAAAVSLNDDDLILLANFALRLKGDGSGVFDLDLPNLSSVYRLARIASSCSPKVQEYLTLLCRMYYPEIPVSQAPCECRSDDDRRVRQRMEHDGLAGRFGHRPISAQVFTHGGREPVLRSQLPRGGHPGLSRIPRGHRERGPTQTGGFNIFNRTCFGGIITDLTRPDFGLPTGPQVGARSIQLVAKVNF